MSEQTYDYSQSEGYSLVPAGEYEVYIDNAEIRTGKTSGKQYISLTFIIRDDIEQQCGGRYIFDSIFEVPTYVKDGKYITKDKYNELSQGEKASVIVGKEWMRSKMKPLVNAQEIDNETLDKVKKGQIKDPRKFTFGSIDEALQILNGTNLIIKVTENSADDYHDDNWNGIDYKGVKRSNNLPKKLGTTNQIEVDEISEEDLPF